MFKRKKSHTVPGLDTTSTADISFMLLIFFLITTSMDSEKGLGRQLPPMDPDEQKQQDIQKDQVLTLHLMKGGKLTIDDRETTISPALRKEVKEFIVKTGEKHIIELQVDRDAEYDTYFRLQNQLVKAYKELNGYQQRITETSTPKGVSEE